MKLVLLTNLFNILDLTTTLYAVEFLGYSEFNRLAGELMKNLPLYVIYKILSVVVISVVYHLTKNSDSPFLVGVNKGCLIGLSVMCVVLASAVISNVSQIIFGFSPFIAILSKILR